MLKDILIRCAELSNRNDIVSELNDSECVCDVLNQSVKADILRMINFCNYTSKILIENYCDLLHFETVTSDEDGKIFYYNLSYEPKEIVGVKVNGQNVNFDTYSLFLKTNLLNTECTVYYNYFPEIVTDFSNEISLPEIYTTALCYGVVSEFFASKNLFKESEFWKNKFLSEVFRMNIKKERRVKSTFSL